MTKFPVISYPSHHKPWRPSDNGWLAATCEPDVANAPGSFNTGFLYAQKVWVPEQITIAALEMGLTNNGVGMTNSFLGVYNKAGTLIGTSAESSAAMMAGAPVKLNFPLTVVGGQSLTVIGGPDEYIYAAELTNSSTAPQIPRTSVLAALLNANQSAAGPYTARAMVSTGTFTALPSVFPTMATTTFVPCVGVL